MRIRQLGRGAGRGRGEPSAGHGRGIFSAVPGVAPVSSRRVDDGGGFAGEARVSRAPLAVAHPRDVVAASAQRAVGTRNRGRRRRPFLGNGPSDGRCRNDRVGGAVARGVRPRREAVRRRTPRGDPCGGGEGARAPRRPARRRLRDARFASEPSRESPKKKNRLIRRRGSGDGLVSVSGGASQRRARHPALCQGALRPRGTRGGAPSEARAREPRG